VGDRNTNKEKADWQVQTDKHRDKDAERKKDNKKRKGGQTGVTDIRETDKREAETHRCRQRILD